MAEFSINKIFSDAFGYEAPKFVIDEPAADKLISGSLGSPYFKEDVLGREMFMPVTFTMVTKDYLIPFAVISINCKKIIVSTPMVERGGSVKEMIAIDDYSINIKGIVINDDNNFPEDQVKELQKLFLANESLTMRSVLTDIFLSGTYDHRVVIKEMKWPAVAAIENARPFELDCESDMNFELIQQ